MCSWTSLKLSQNNNNEFFFISMNINERCKCNLAIGDKNKIMVIEMQVNVLKIILNSLNLILKFRLVMS